MQAIYQGKNMFFLDMYPTFIVIVKSLNALFFTKLPHRDYFSYLVFLNSLLLVLCESYILIRRNLAVFTLAPSSSCFVEEGTLCSQLLCSFPLTQTDTLSFLLL